MNYLDHEGIFRARPIDWRIKQSENTASIAIEIDFVVLERLDGEAWTDLRAYDETRVRGRYFVVKKDGQANVGTVQQLSSSMGWNGSLRAVRQAPPECVVQVTVKAEEYQGKTYYRAGWMNPGDYVPTADGASDQEVDILESRFGSLLRAAAAAKPAAPAKPMPPTPPAKPAQKPEPKPVDTGDMSKIPF